MWDAGMVCISVVGESSFEKQMQNTVIGVWYKYNST